MIDSDNVLRPEGASIVVILAMSSVSAFLTGLLLLAALG